MKIAVIGAGIYGCTVALRLHEEGFDVEIFEKESDLMQVTSEISRRSHAGYFYPRSSTTIQACKADAPRFETYYPKSIIRDYKNYYVVSKTGSKVTSEEYLAVLEHNDLPYEKIDLPLLNPSMVAVAVEAREFFYDIATLRKEIRRRISAYNIPVHHNTKPTQKDLSVFALKIIANYAFNGRTANELGIEDNRPYTYRLCEKVIVSLPPVFSRRCFMVVDGAFFSIEPFDPAKGTFIVSHLKHSAHHASTGLTLDNHPMHELVGKGVVHIPTQTHFAHHIEAISEFIPEVRNADYQGSLFAIKAILPNNAEDARPTLVMPLQEDTLSIFSGKVSGSIRAADECVAYAKLFRKAESKLSSNAHEPLAAPKVL